MLWYSESFIFLVMTMCAGGVMAVLGGIGCFLLALFDKDESTGSVTVGKFLNVKGVSLILLSVCGIGLMCFSVYSWTQIQKDEGMEMMESLGYYEEWPEDEMWLEEEAVGGVEDDDVQARLDELFEGLVVE
jgi:membrane-bound ClpP family serine protease